MGALTINRKRSDDYFSSNYSAPLPNFDHTSKRRKLSAHIYQNPNLPLSSKSTFSRVSRYPDPINPIPREVHAPCRNSRFGSNPNSRYAVSFSDKVPAMGNFISSKYDEAKRIAYDTLRYLKKDKEVIDIDDGVKEDKSEDSSIEELEAEGWVKRGSLDQKWKEDNGVVEILDGFEDQDKERMYQPSCSPVVATKEENAGEMLYSLDVNPSSDSYSYVALYKKLLAPLQKINDNLKRRQFEIKYYEKRRETCSLLRPQRVKKDLITEPFVPLTPEEEAEVSCALYNSNRRRVLVTHENSNVDITVELLQCLRPRAWLNDEVINLYLELLKEREKREPQKFLKCHFFNTFFYKKLIGGKGGYNFQSVRRWTSQRKLGYCLLDCDKIFVPIHKEIHWCLAVINKKDEEFQYLDSLRGTDTQVLKVLARYFVDEVRDKTGKNIDVSSWKQEFVEDLPEQKNGFDCGVFMIKYADFYSRDIGLCFNQEHMPYFRLRTAKELLRLKAE